MPINSAETEDRLNFSVVVPLFNEEQNIAELYRRTTSTLETGLLRYEIVFVDDGSDDATPILLDALGDHDPRVAVLHLSRNFGHQAAISAGLDHARGLAVAVLDGDLQDPPELIPDLVRLWQKAMRLCTPPGATVRKGCSTRRLLLVLSPAPLDE